MAQWQANPELTQSVEDALKVGRVNKHVGAVLLILRRGLSAARLRAAVQAQRRAWQTDELDVEDCPPLMARKINDAIQFMGAAAAPMGSGGASSADAGSAGPAPSA